MGYTGHPTAVALRPAAGALRPAAGALQPVARCPMHRVLDVVEFKPHGPVSLEGGPLAAGPG